MRFKRECSIPNKTKKFTFLNKLDRVILQLHNMIHACFIGTKMHGYGLILGKSLDSIDSGGLYTITKSSTYREHSLQGQLASQYYQF